MTLKTAGIIVIGVLILGGINRLIVGTPQQIKTQPSTTYHTPSPDKLNTGIKEGSVISTYTKAHWIQEYGGDLPIDFKINLWENTLSWNKGKGKIKGYTLPGNNLVVIMVKENDYLVSDRQTGGMGWISKIQMNPN